jgi:adenine-specific DNA-methyltransferase
MLKNTETIAFKPRTIRYYGGKAKLADFIINGMEQFGLKEGMSVLDAFSGTSVIAQELKHRGFHTFANDHLYFCYALADAHLAFNEVPDFKKLKLSVGVFDYLNSLPAKKGFLTKNYSPFGSCERMYLSIVNAGKVDAIRDQIQEWQEAKKINTSEFNYLIASMVYAINLVSNITGTYGAYLKFWEGRSTKDLLLTPIEVSPSQFQHQAFYGDVLDAVSRQRYDFIYLDPPYNARGYYSNYFFLEIVAKGWYDNIPIPSGVTGIPKNLEVRSDYSSKREVSGAFQRLISKCSAEYIALSYNNEGLLSQDRLMEILNDAGEVKVLTQDHKRYRSINQDGNNSMTQELLFVVRKK